MMIFGQEYYYWLLVGLGVTITMLIFFYFMPSNKGVK